MIRELVRRLPFSVLDWSHLAAHRRIEKEKRERAKSNDMVFQHESHMTNGSAITSLRNKLDFLFVAQGAEINLYSLDGFKEITKYIGHYKPINALSFQDITSFVSVSNQIVIHDVSKTEPLRRIYSESRFNITDVEPLNADILAICEDRSIKLFDMRQKTSYTPIQVFSDARDSLNTLDYDPSRCRLYSGGNDGILLTYDLRQGLLVKDPLNDCITDMCIYKGDLVLNTFGGVKTVTDKGLTKKTWHKEPDDKAYRIDIEQFNEGIITGSESGHLYFWDEKVTKYKLCDSVISAIDATDLIYCGDNNGRVHTIRL